MILKVLDVRLDITNYMDATQQVLEWAKCGTSHYVCAANVHTLMETYDSPDFKEMVNSADLITPDGMPLVWMMRAKGVGRQERVYGPFLMLQVLEAAIHHKIPIGFYGSAPKVLDLLIKRLQARYAEMRVAYSFSPPYRALSPEEDARIVEQINQSGTKILFVGLGCPKQEIWMAKHHGRIQAVMLGVGAAFDFHAGVKLQAPLWMQRLGLEWLFRFVTEPRRLWKRYLYHNPRFVVLAIADLLGFLKRAA
jgi:N-acetylglucosaminyldiphosphoundecaprenol N-acetyl-beta-D-mannosaminyltransferase